MEEPRPEKVAVVDEVRGKFTDADAVVFTEYRGLTVRDLADLRNELRPAGGEYKVYKNTLVRRATKELDLDFDETLLGPVALAFVGQQARRNPRRCRSGGEGAQGLRQGEPVAGHQGRTARRPGARRIRCPGPGRRRPA